MGEHLDDFEAREKDTAEALKRARIETEELKLAVGRLMATADGKRFVFWLLSRSGLYAEALSPGRPDVTGYALGRQSMGRDVLAQLDAVDARLYPRLMLDMAELRELDRAAHEAAEKARQPEDGDEDYA